MVKGNKSKTTKQKGKRGPAPRGANTQVVPIPRNPKYDALDARDTPVTYRGMNLVYNALGTTDAGRMWALLALHPCGEYISSCDGIPDESMASAVTPTYRASSTIGWDPKLFVSSPITAPTGSFNYDVQIITPPFPEIDYCYRLGYQGTWSDWVPVKMPSFNSSEDGTATTLSSCGMSKYRFVARGMTLYLDCPTLNDNGRYIGGQIAAHVEEDSYEWSRSVETDSKGDLHYGQGITHTYTMTIPDDEHQLVLQDNLAAQWPAKEGAYIPHRFISPVQLYGETTGGHLAKAISKMTDGSMAELLVPKSLMCLSKLATAGRADAVMHFVTNGTWVAPSGGGALSPTMGIWGVSRPGNLNTGVSFFKAISSTASIQVKSRVYLEAEATTNNSPAAPFSHKPPTLDRTALDIVTKVAQAQPHVFFARDNDFSSILKSIGKMLPSVLGWVQPWADKAAKTGLPFIAPAGLGVGALSRGFRSAYDHLFGS